MNEKDSTVLFLLEKAFFNDYFSHAKRLREIFSDNLARIRVILITEKRPLPQREM
ncbi:phosphoribosylamine--glycine ligase [Vibrio cincinnatiensis]|uniref:phosphoribosylamine--glycine ligase n=1 Tax=Vibrio cincinnatiensis TaxID=675 RepID=UPI003D359315|nr:phosphoribosylamine--glycine ligase [Vibrio cincinnatiensis]